MRTLLNEWLKAEGVSQPRITKINEHLDQPTNSKILEEDWILSLENNNRLGMLWRNNIKQITYDLETLNIDDTAILSLDFTDPDRPKKQYRLPPAMSGAKFGEWLNQYKEIIDFWVGRAIKKDE